jgi:insecticidal toxin complex protein TccC
LSDHIGSNQIELNQTAEITSFESYYPYGGTAIWSTKNQIESNYKYYRYSGKECDHSGLYYYGYRYYMPWLGRWLNADPSGISDGLNLFRMVRNNPVTFVDDDGCKPTAQHFKTIFGFKDPKTGRVKPMSIHRKSKKKFWHITKIFTHDHEKDVDVRVLEVGKGMGKGKKRGFYLFTGRKSAERLLISVHGGFLLGSKPIDLTPDMPVITVLGPHGQGIFSDDYARTDKPYAKISYQRITLSSKEAENAFESEGYAKLSGTATKRAVLNYSFEKIETDPYEEKEYFYMRHLFEFAADAVHKSRELGKEPFDVLALRKGTETTLADVLALAKKLGYKEIVCEFCRDLEGGEEDYYHPVNTNLLETEKIIDWEDMPLDLTTKRG